MRVRSKKGASEIAQFPLAIYCMFLVVLLPVLNLVALIIAGTTAYLATNDVVAKAAAQPNFAQALNAMAVDSYNFQSNTLAKFVKMVPSGGYAGCGDDLYVVATDIGGAGVQSSAADTSLTSPIDPTKYIYEMQVVSSYTVAPLVSMASFPLLGNIPGLGQPVTFSFAATRPVEHPGGMQQATSSGNTSAVSNFNRVTTTAPTNPTQTTGVTWRNPNIYQLIQAAGETVVSVNVVQVNANNPNPTPTGVTVTPGEQIWVDTSAVGQWTSQTPSSAWFDANGSGSVSSQFIATYGQLVDPSVGQTMLLGEVGGGPMFGVGDFQFNYSLSNSGVLGLQCNDSPNYYGDNQGTQMVRVIVTR